ncbi:MAG: rhodanese-like domain-containing protein [Burkholderiales bacterium]|jgi:rhodanese-related sulfurtransferase
MPSAPAILAAAQQRGRELKLPYAGALLPADAHELMQTLPEARLVDVRTRAELEWVGQIPGSISVEWNTWPGGRRNLDFIAEFEALVDRAAIVMLLCRSAVRSHLAAIALSQCGYEHAYNILQGFEGDKDPSGQRNRLGGWRAAGLPWKQD